MALRSILFSISAENRKYTALAGRTPNGELVAVVAMDNGQFNRYFGGSQVIQQTAYTAPESGTASYEGNYVGLINVASSITPADITGIVRIDANFADPKIEGDIRSRVAVVNSISIPVQDIVFVNTTIRADGTFAGVAEFRDEDLTGVGTYSGAAAGSGSPYIGGNISIGSAVFDGLELSYTTDQLDAIIGEDRSQIQEYGIFLTESCGSLATDC